MAYSARNKQKKIKVKRVKRLKKYEKLFSAHKYKGKGKTFLKDILGSSDIILASPYSVNCYDMGDIKANQLTGALAILLANETGCRTLFAQKSFKKIDRESVKNCYIDMIGEKGCNAIVELRINAFDNHVVRLGEYGFINENQKSFFGRLVKYIFEYEYRNFEAIENVVGMYNYSQESILSEVAKKLKIPVIVLDINANVFNLVNSSVFERGYEALKKIIILLTSIDWTTDNYDIYRVWQANAKSQLPQDKIEFANIENTPFSENNFLHIGSFEGNHETVRVNKINNNTLNELNDYLSNHNKVGKSDEYIILTNRLIETLFGREWFEGVEELPGLRGIPIIVYKIKREEYEIGIPKANQVNDIALSTELYKEKLPLSLKYDYLLFNRYSDSRIYIEIENADYQDNGRVKSKEGIPNAKKVMLPRYYRLMMGYLEKPLKIIRAEEYLEMLKENGDILKHEILKEDFERVYEKILGQPYFQLKDEEKILGGDEEKKQYNESKEKIIQYFEKKGVYSYVELIHIPKKIKPKKKFCEQILEFRDKVRIKILKTTIGKAEYILKTNWAGDTDDKNSVARLNNNMMSLIGVSENDKILIKFGEKIVILRVLAKDDLSDYEIGIPSSGRRALGMNSMNDIVIVHRDMLHAFKRHSQEQTIAILGTVLAVAQVLMAFDFFTKTWVGIIIAAVDCITAIVLMLYFALSEERVKVK